MVVKNTKTKNKEFNYDKNEATIQMFSYLGAGVRIRKTRKMVEVQKTVFPNKDSSMTKVMRSKVNIPPIKTHSPMKMMIKTHSPMKMMTKTHSPMKTVKYNLSKSFKLNKVERSKNGVCREQGLVDN